MQIIMKDELSTQSYHKHFIYEIPKKVLRIEGYVFDPLIKLTMTCAIKTVAHNPCFFHYAWLSSFLRINSNSCISSSLNVGSSSTIVVFLYFWSAAALARLFSAFCLSLLFPAISKSLYFLSIASSSSSSISIRLFSIVSGLSESMRPPFFSAALWAARLSDFCLCSRVSVKLLDISIDLCLTLRDTEMLVSREALGFSAWSMSWRISPLYFLLKWVKGLVGGCSSSSSSYFDSVFYIYAKASSTCFFFRLLSPDFRSPRPIFEDFRSPLFLLFFDTEVSLAFFSLSLIALFSFL